MNRTTTEIRSIVLGKACLKLICFVWIVIRWENVKFILVKVLF